MQLRSVASMTLLASLDATFPSPEDEFLFREAEDLLDDQIDRLDRRHLIALIMRYGLGEDEPATYKAIGRTLGVTTNRASRICRDAEDELRQIIVTDRFDARAAHMTAHAGRYTKHLQHDVALPCVWDSRNESWLAA